MIAQELALAHPERVDKLVLVATVPGGPRQPPHAPGHHLPIGLGAIHDQPGQAAGVRRTTLGPTTLRRRPKLARRLVARKLAHPQPESAWRAQTAAGMLFNPLGRQRRITQPTLIVQGTADKVVALGNADVLAGLVPNARVQRFHGAGHLLYWEQPKRFVRVVTDFLTDPATAAHVPATAADRAS